jgi:penicillin amidase
MIALNSFFMRVLKLLGSLVVLTTLVITFNTRIHRIPPVGKFFNPFYGFWQNARSASLDKLPKIINLPGLSAPVEVDFDEHLIPHIKASNDYDLYLVQGYITAYHRLWQMEFNSHAASGRLSEIFGQVTLNYDRLQRRKGLGMIAQKILDNASEDPVFNDILNAYTQGVNSFIKSLTYKNLPIEYKIFDYEPELWEPIKTAFINALMIDVLSGKDSALEFTNAVNMLGYERFNFMYPDYPNGLQPIVPTKKENNFATFNINTPKIEIPSVLSSSLPEEEFYNGSNNWVVSSAKTADKKVYLANDPHLDLNLPAIWYLCHLQSGDGIKVFGASSPGAPSILIGFNQHIAWGITNAMSNVRDWYKIDFKDKEKNTYVYDNAIFNSSSVVEKIKIRNEKDFYDTVIYTHHGPVVYDEHFNQDGNYLNLAMRWTGHMPEKEILTFHLVTKAKSYEEFKKAFTCYAVPNLNFAFASREDIAMDVVGKYPLKFKEQGKFIMPGNKKEYLWTNFVPQEHMPSIKNPKSGYLVSANQHPTDSKYPYYHHSHAYMYYRHRRITDILANLKEATLQDMIDLQNDDYNLCAAESLTLLLSYVDVKDLNTEQKYFYDNLLAWDFRDSLEYESPSMFEVWSKNIRNELWKFLDEKKLKIIKPSFYVTIDIIKNHPASPYLEFGEYGNLKTLINQTFKQSVEQLKKWSDDNNLQSAKWGDYKKLSIKHLANIDAFSIKDFKLNGSLNTVQVSYGNLGTSLKIVIELGPTAKCWLIYPGGQSGNVSSKYYSNLFDRWLAGEYIEINLDRSDSFKTSFKVNFKP